MKESTDIGLNRTGVSMSPLLTKEMLGNDQGLPRISPEGAWEDFDARRAEFLAEEEPVGTVPLPATFKAAGTTIMQKLKGTKPEVFLDKLGERAAFERSGCRLYDMLLAKCASRPEGEADLPMDELRKIREEEETHFLMMVDTLTDLGADPTCQTPAADVNGVASMGLFQVLADPRTSLPQCLQAILLAEMADNSGWELLITLARGMGMDELVPRFEKALEDEQRHLRDIRALHDRMVLDDARVTMN